MNSHEVVSPFFSCVPLFVPHNPINKSDAKGIKGKTFVKNNREGKKGFLLSNGIKESKDKNENCVKGLRVSLPRMPKERQTRERCSEDLLEDSVGGELMESTSKELLGDATGVSR
jgi:hypothetical protein